MHALGALTWDPQVRGFLIVLVAVLILPGSVYLLLATNMGAKVGFLLALAGITGWITILAIIWMAFGIGMIGRVPSWKVKEVITGDIHASAVPAMAGFPKGWTKMAPGSPELGDAQAAADAVLAPSATPAPGTTGTPAAPAFQSPFHATTDYAQWAGYHMGGNNWLFTIRRHHFYLFHSAHWDVVQVRPVISPNGGPGGAPPKAAPDPTMPITNVIMVRDLGSTRFPPFLLALGALTIFLVDCYVLHRRDKEIMALRNQPALA